MKKDLLCCRWPMFGFRIDVDVRRKLRIWSIRHDIAVAEVARGLIEILLDERDEMGALLQERLMGE